jgi:hypothetical protein
MRHDDESPAAGNDTAVAHEVPALPPPAGVAGPVRVIVAAHVEELTRFDDADLGQAQPEEYRAVHATLVATQGLRFEIRTAMGAGNLAAGIDSCAGTHAMASILQQRLAQARLEAPAAIQTWSGADRQRYRRLLKPAHAFVSPSNAAGHDYTCGTCGGNRRVRCEPCLGEGSTHCYPCGGRGSTNCGSCGGSKQTNCISCGGSGGMTKYAQASQWNSSTGAYEYVSTSFWGNCDACNGSGRKTCYSCDHAGQVGCYGCGGKGRVTCIPCGASGKVNCGPCAATGRQHEYGRVVAHVDLAEALAIDEAPPEVEALIRSKIDIDQLPEFGELMALEHQALPGTVRSTYRIRLDVREALLEARGAQFKVHGFGPESTVFDFQNIAGHLLEGDLDTFEASVQAPVHFGKRQARLLELTADFLRSELNMLIAEKVADAKAAPEAAAVEAHFKALVGPRYIERAASALSTALRRLYGAELGEPAVYLCGITALGAAAMAAFGWPYAHWLPNSALVVGTAACAWFMVEWSTRRRITAGFEPALASRVLKQVRLGGSVRRWRVGMACAGVLAALAGSFGISQVPAVRTMQDERLEIAQAPALIQSWLQQTEVDWQQRSYPSRKLLEREAGRGNWRAQLILGWQFLLGADGLTKDVKHAGALLDQIAPQAGYSEVWKVAKAVQALHQESTLAQLRETSTALKQSADRGSLVEARFWEARTYLDPRSPVHDMRRAAAALKAAADKGHSHAALLLGQHLAERKGRVGNIRQARHYLEMAERAGLDKARAALAQLK